VSWKNTLAKGLNRVEHGVDRARFALMERFGVRKPLRIQPYIGHGNQTTAYVRGRVLLDNDIRKPTQEDSLWDNLINTYRRFESDEIPYATVRASIDGTQETVQCDEEGFFKVALTPPDGLPADAFWQTVQLECVDTPISNLDVADCTAQARVIVPPSTARFGVISDLDDTVMKTDVLNLLKMLRNTVFQNAYTRVPFDGVAAFYRALREGQGDDNNPIFYVSSSPWNLYDFIIDFYDHHDIPLGPVYLRDIGLAAHAIGGESHMGHKLAYINRLMERHPDLPFILIGDSGQKDIWVYEEAVKLHPGRVQTIYIRDVAARADDNEVAGVIARVAELGAEMLLVQDTKAAAAHAVANGYIRSDEVPEIQHEAELDEVVQ